MSNNNFSFIGYVITLIGVFSFLALLVINLVVALLCLINPTIRSWSFLIGFTIVVWGIWYGVVLVIKSKRATA